MTREEVLSVIAEHADLPSADDAPLELASLQLVVIAEALETRFGFIVAARELNAENFETLERILAFARRKVPA